MSLTLSASELSKLANLSASLLSPLEVPSFDVWRDRAVGDLWDLLGGDTGSFLIAGIPGEATLWNRGLPEELASAYAAGYAADEGVRRSLPLGAYTQTAAVGGDWGWYRRDPTVNELLLPNGLRDVAGLVYDPMGVHTRAQLCTTRERYGTKSCNEHARQMLSLVLPSFRSTIDFIHRLYPEMDSLASRIDQIDVAVWAFSLDGVLLHRNRSAIELLSAVPDGGLIDKAASSAAAGLTSSLSAAKSSGGNPVPAGAAFLTVGSSSYRLHVSLIRDEGRGWPRGTIVTATRATEISNLLRSLGRARGLTDRQSEVAVLIAKGLSAKAISQRLGISVHTVRRHSELIFQKLGICSRSQIRQALEEGSDGLAQNTSNPGSDSTYRPGAS